MEFVLIWIALAAGVGVFASRNGRVGFIAFLWSILLSPLIGFIIYAAMGENEKSKVDRIYEEERIRAEARSKFEE